MTAQTSHSRDRVLDELLVLRSQEGHEPSFEMLVRRWQRRLWRYARNLTGSDDAAWDITQETWIAIFRQIRTLRDPSWFRAWACRIVRNKSADFCRRSGRQRHLVQMFAEQPRKDGEPVSQDRDARVKRALDRLDSDKKELLMLKYRENLTVVEIAVVLGIPAGTVKSRLHQAREDVRRILEGDQS